MKKIYILLALVLASHISWAQCEPNGTLTDVQHPSPQGAGYRTNTMDWQEPQLPINAPTSMPLIQQRLSIFYSSKDWHIAIADNTYDTLRDHHPEDGWELIKQDLGYLYDAGASPEWQGHAVPAGGFQHPTTGTWVDATTVPYIILYNKYSATLRVIGLYKKYDGYQHIKIKVAFDKYEGDETPVSALFDIYNSPEIAPLDQKTKIDNVEALAKFGDVDWFYADFPMAYDACTCEFDSRLEVSFWGIELSQITATGRILGTAMPISDITGSSDYLQGDQFGDQFFTSFYDDPALTPADLDQMVGHYKDALQLASEVGNRTGDPDVLGSVMKGIDLSISITKAFLPGGSFLIDSLSVKNIANAVGAANGILGKGLSFYKSLNSKPKATTTKPMAISAQLILKGKSISEDLFDKVKIANPGSQKAYTFGEYPVSQDPVYPMYNEVMGHFNLVHTPKFQYFSERIGHSDRHCPSPWEDDPDEYNAVYSESFKLDPSTVSYVLNPIIDPELSSILVAIELKKSSTESILTPFVSLECAGAFLYKNEYDDGPCGLYDKLIVKGLVFSNTYVFRPDVYGNVAVHSELLKFPVEEELSQHALTGKPFNTIPTDLHLHNQVLSGGTEIYSFGTITIDGQLSYSGSGPVYVRAEEAIELLPGASIDPNIILELSSVPTCTAEAILPTHMTRDMCLRDKYYKADQISNKRIITEEKSKARKGYLYLTLHPNPARDIVHLSGIDAEQVDRVVCLDALGRMIHQWEGYTDPLDVSMLQSGMYLIQVRYIDGRVSESHKLGIAR